MVRKRTNRCHTPTRDCIQINCCGEKGIVILVTAEAIELRLPTIEWKGPHEPVASSRFWKRIQESEIADKELGTILREALRGCLKIQVNSTNG
jgi:hypothetical protein